jgi:hypothetical protein
MMNMNMFWNVVYCFGVQCSLCKMERLILAMLIEAGMAFLHYSVPMIIVGDRMT